MFNSLIILTKIIQFKLHHRIFLKTVSLKYTFYKKFLKVEVSIICQLWHVLTTVARIKALARCMPSASPDVSRSVLNFPDTPLLDKSECNLTHCRATFRAESKTKFPPALHTPMTLRKCQNGALDTWSTCIQATTTLIGKKSKRNIEQSTQLKLWHWSGFCISWCWYKQLTTAGRNHIYPVIGSVRGSVAWFVTGGLQLIAVIGSF